MKIVHIATNVSFAHFDASPLCGYSFVEADSETMKKHGCLTIHDYFFHISILNKHSHLKSQFIWCSTCIDNIPDLYHINNTTL